MKMQKGKWSQGRYFLLESAKYRPESDLVWLQFRNRDAFEVSGSMLWQNRPGKPNWKRLRIDPDTRGALLVPTAQGAVEEIPGDVIRMATNADYRAYIVGVATRWAGNIGPHLAA